MCVSVNTQPTVTSVPSAQETTRRERTRSLLGGVEVHAGGDFVIQMPFHRIILLNLSQFKLNSEEDNRMFFTDCFLQKGRFTDCVTEAVSKSFLKRT